LLLRDAASGHGAIVGSGATAARTVLHERPRIHDMPSLLDWVPLLFAENAPAANPNGAASGPLSLPILLLVAGVWGYFLLLRPQQQQEKKRREMIAALKKNDRVLTTSGLYGTVVSVDVEQDRVVLRVDDDKGVKLTFSKSAVNRVVDTTPDKVAVSS